MQTTSTSNSSSKTTKRKVPAKTRSRGKAPPTLHLKEKHLAATSTGDLAPMIATAAYFRAEQRGFEPGHELEDWLHAEQQVRSRIS
jgi:hypothetical protein